MCYAKEKLGNKDGNLMSFWHDSLKTLLHLVSTFKKVTCNCYKNIKILIKMTPPPSEKKL